MPQRRAPLSEGEAQIDVPEGTESLYADVPSTRCRHTFALSDELAADEIDRALKDGGLTVRIPKRAEARTRRNAAHTG